MLIFKQYKKVIVISSFITMTFLFGNFTTKYIKSGGAHPGSTGAPGEETCAMAGCHYDALVLKDSTGLVNTFKFSSDSIYVPGQTYTLSLKVKRGSLVRFGFEIVALNDSANTNAGSWNITDTDRVQEITEMISGSQRHFLTHTFEGNVATGNGENIWTFDWKAPDKNVGNITFYYATNCTNNDDMSTGDEIYLSSFKIRPMSSSISEFLNQEKSKIYFSSSDNEIVFDYTLKKNKNISLRIVDASGKLVYEKSLDVNIGRGIERVHFSNDISKGIYFGSIVVDGKYLTEKIVIQ